MKLLRGASTNRMAVFLRLIRFDRKSENPINSGILCKLVDGYGFDFRNGRRSQTYRIAHVTHAPATPWVGSLMLAFISGATTTKTEFTKTKFIVTPRRVAAMLLATDSSRNESFGRKSAIARSHPAYSCLTISETGHRGCSRCRRKARLPVGGR